MPATAFDLRSPDRIVAELGDASRLLEGERELPPAVIALVEAAAQTIGEAHDHELAAVNPWLWITIQGAALRAQGALREDDPAVARRQVRLALEQLRFLFARVADRAPVGEDRPAAEVARWLDDKLAALPQQRKAELLGVGVRTYQRWLSRTGPTAPSPADERRLRLVTRIVNQLRHSLSGPGVVDWFAHPRADLGGAAPEELLGAPERLEELLAAVAASRGNVAA